MFKSKEENRGQFIPCRFSEESEKSACNGKTHPAIKTNKEYKQNLNVKVKYKKTHIIPNKNKESGTDETSASRSVPEKRTDRETLRKL